MSSQVRIVDLPNREKGKDDDKGKSSSSSRKTSSRTTSTATQDRDLRTRLLACFRRIAEAADARGDEELAEVIREDAEVMATGLVSLTRPFRALRAPVFLLLAIVEPVMAFSRIGRLMIGRMMYRRAERRTERQEEVPVQ